MRSLAASDYPELEVIVVDDGSTDDTADIVEASASNACGCCARPTRGKAAALNAGIAAARLKSSSWSTATPSSSPRRSRGSCSRLPTGVGAVSGNTKVGNRRGLLGRWQHIEYVMGFNLDRRMYEVLQCTPTVPGAIGAFRRDVLTEVGRRLRRHTGRGHGPHARHRTHRRRVVYAEDARAWTEAPSTLRRPVAPALPLVYGTMQAVWKHRAPLSRDPRERRDRAPRAART